MEPKETLGDEDNKIFEDATALRYSNSTKAVEMFHYLLDKHGRQSPILSVLAGTYYYMNDFKNAEKFFKETTGLSPLNELASIGLYHCLKDRSQYEQAEAEMLRFLRAQKAKHGTLETGRNLYKVLLEESNKNFADLKLDL